MDEVVSVADIYSKAEQVFNDKFNNKKFTTSNVSWDGRTTTLRDVLGDLLNYPGGVETLRGWIERVENLLNNINGSGSSSVDLTEIESRISTLESKVAALEANSDNDADAVSIINNVL